MEIAICIIGVLGSLCIVAFMYAHQQRDKAIREEVLNSELKKTIRQMEQQMKDHQKARQCTREDHEKQIDKYKKRIAQLTEYVNSHQRITTNRDRTH